MEINCRVMLRKRECGIENVKSIISEQIEMKEKIGRTFSPRTLFIMFILFIETTTIPSTKKLIRQLPKRV